MYARDVDGQVLNLAVSGKLWESSLVMVDQETGSLWSHILGQCMQGELVGRELTVVPSVVTDWETWRAKHPDTTVAWMSPTTGNYHREAMSPDGGLVLGLSRGHDARCWSYSDLNANPILQDKFLDRNIVIFYQRKSLTASIFDRSIGDRLLSFRSEPDGSIQDRETGSTWDGVTGEALAGPLQGEQLKLLPGIISDNAAWATFHPLGTTWSETEQRDEVLPEADADAGAAQAPEVKE